MARDSLSRTRIAFFGLRNAGKSSLVNAVTAQNLAIVSPVKGTTTDPVKKTMEILPIGPVLIIDTPGLDDEGDLGSLRVSKTREVLRSCDIAILVTDGTGVLQAEEEELLAEFAKRNLPYLIAVNKSDAGDYSPAVFEALAKAHPGRTIRVSAEQGEGVEELRSAIAKSTQESDEEQPLLADLIEAGDVVILVTPIDSSAPQGRMILPQMQTLRAVLDCRALAVTVQTDELPLALQSLHEPPRLVITDSQAFGTVKTMLPDNVPLTSFSILFARYKGFLAEAVKGARMLDHLSEQTKILIAEGCTHHRHCEDIGTVKIPNLIRKHSGVNPEFHFSSGNGFPTDLSAYDLIIHCGACMLNEKELQYRKTTAQGEGVPFTNYGITLAHLNGILERSIEVFDTLAE